VVNYNDTLKQDDFDYSEIDPSQGEELKCIVKWFNPSKGFGFVMPEGVDEDIFLHFSVLDTAGYQYLSPGDEVNCIVGIGNKGRQVGKIMEVQPARQSPGPYQFGYRPAQPVSPLQETEGEVKWFNTIRGFGFVTPDDGGRDIFVHASVLRRLGLQKIYPGQRVRMQATNSDRGRQAWTLDLIE
jgi:CspA family cold shock protein